MYRKNKKMKKVLIFSIAYYPNFVGGAEVAVKELTDRLASYDFSLITLGKKDDKKEEMIGRVKVYRVGEMDKLNKLFFFLKAYLKARELNKKENFDIVWSIMANYAGFAALLFKFLNKDKKFILTLQEGDPIEYIERKTFFVRYFFNQIFKKADKIQVISNFLKDWALSKNKNASVLVVPNGVDVNSFDRETDSSTLEEKNEGEIRLITTSRLVKKNGIEFVIKALKDLDSKIKFTIIGKGELEESLKSLAKNLGIESRVEFLGFIEQKEIVKYLKNSDIFIRPSLSEGLGNSFIEAMVARVPVVATPVGGIVDFLVDKETGYFVEVENVESIVKVVNYIINNKEEVEKVVDNAYKIAKNNYDWDKISQKMDKEVFQ